MRVVVDVVVARREGVVELAYALAGLYGYILFALDAHDVSVEEEGKQVGLVGQLGEGEGDVGRKVGAVEVVDAKLVEVAGDNPARAHVAGQVVGVPFRLFEWGLLAGFLAALAGLVQRYAAAFLLDEDAHVLVEDVDFAAAYLALELQYARGVGDA